MRIVGATAERAKEPGHDLTYLADAGLGTGTEMPPTFYAGTTTASAFEQTKCK